MPYLEIDGRQVYHETWGSGEPLVLLHGGHCSLEVMRELAELLAQDYAVHAFERTGHGRTPDREGPYSYDGMAAETVAYLDAVGLADAHLVGFSDGAVATLLVARDHPTRVRTAVPISGNISTDAYVGEDYPVPVITPEAIAQVNAEYAELSPDGPEHSEVIDEKIGALWAVEPDVPVASLARITAPTLVMSGEHDAIRHDHTDLVTAAIPGATQVTIPGTTHMLVREKPAEVAAAVRGFLAEVAAR